MATDYTSEFDDIPGTRVFTAQRAKQGFNLNEFCMSLMKPENRERFKADERAYLDEWPMTEGQKQAVLDRDYNAMLDQGGNIYFLAKIFATDGLSYLQAVSTMTGMDIDDYQQMMISEGAVYRRLALNQQKFEMARITAGLTTSHIPAIGAAIDLGKTGRAVLATAVRRVRVDQGLGRRGGAGRGDPGLQRPRVRVLARARPHVRTRLCSRIPPADEGYGPRPVPVVRGNADLAAHLAQSLILDEFDLTLMYKLDVDHGLTVPLSLVYGQPDEWPVRVIPLAVNVVQYPPPTGHRCYMLGKAIRRAVQSYPGDLSVQVWGTGGMSHPAGPARRVHQLQVRQRVLRPADRRPGRPGARAAHRVRAGGGLRGDRAGHAADHARRDGPGRRGAVPLLPRPRVQHRGRASRGAAVRGIPPVPRHL